ncbi:MAG: LacI family DNA-binding transcriptional regulator [Kiritimatiellae bacterium]|nr:LacI family DNA-binding transcriptional regulator [Kiritimatiellia bacterium]
MKKITLADIGGELGLDKSSISLALRGSPKIAAATRARVRDVALRMGYQPNLAARQLRTRRPQSVGLVLSTAYHTLQSEVAVRTIQALAELSVEAGLFFTIVPGGERLMPAEQPEVHALLPDGMLVWGGVPAEMASRLRVPNRPVLVLDPSHRSYRGYKGPAVGVDNEGGASAIVKHLLARGAKRLLCVRVRDDHIGHDRRAKAAQQTWQGARAARTLKRCDLAALSEGDLREFCANPHGAIFCSNDAGALEIWRRLREAGVSVPDQVRLAGFDGENPGRLIGLTSAVFDWQALARKAFETLCAMLRGRRPGRLIPIPAVLRAGTTT